ncbi:lytic murein transglycosylase [Fretibacter rubidus]|uniref:lytic murein transglycosylase n=1 Tax=Fretibacter rubidus TaxID=570162 RepID=UPI00352AEF5A
MWIRTLSSIIITSAVISAGCATPKAVANDAVNVTAAATVTKVELTQDQRFDAWKKDFTSRAIDRGYDPAIVRAMISPAKINPLALERDKTQPEFNSPIWAYVDKTTSVDRVTRGKALLSENQALFADIEARYRVNPYVLTAIWGLESSYGRILGTHYIIDALATFAFEGRRTKFGEEQLFATLDIVKSGKVRPAQLVGSWAGAMGMTQFIPTTFRDYAVDFDNNGNKDLWKSEADALGSAAHYLSRFGWRLEEPIYTEVKLAQGFDYSIADGRKMSVNDWSALGVAPITGQRWSADAGFLEAKLLVPAGAKGPKFLTFKNFDVIKKYNNSTSYALGIATLSEAYRDRATITAPWPKSDKQVGRTDLKAMQAKLTALGYDTKGADGIVGPNTRRAIRNWQTANGLTADGYIEQKLFEKIMVSR